MNRHLSIVFDMTLSNTPLVFFHTLSSSMTKIRLDGHVTYRQAVLLSLLTYAYSELTYETGTLDTLNKVLLAEEVKDNQGSYNKYTRSILNNVLINRPSGKLFKLE